MATIKNIIFDLGGVLLNIDYNRTAEAFKRLGAMDFKSQFSQYKADDLFEALEVGKISEKDFYTAMQKQCNEGTSFGDIKNAWNAILIDFRMESINFLNKLNKKYNLFLLSNTNSIHLTAFHEIFKSQTGRDNFDSYFKEAYYSHIINKRKPYPSTYTYILEHASINADDTLFIDDSKNNIEGALEAGLNVHWLAQDERIEDLTYE